MVIAVPFVGGALDSLAGTAGSNITLDRLRVVMDEFGQRIATLEEAKRDPAVTVDDVIDATIRAVRGAIETDDTEKVRMLVSILVGATSIERPRPDLDAESVIASLVSLTPADLAYARTLVDAPPDPQSAIFDLARVPTPGPDSQFRLMRLQGAGLLESEGSGGMLGPGHSGPTFRYRFTPTMGRILELLRAGGETIGEGVNPAATS